MSLLRKKMRFYRKSLAKAQRKLSKCIFGSNRYYKQKHKVALLSGFQVQKHLALALQ